MKLLEPCISFETIHRSRGKFDSLSHLSSWFPTSTLAGTSVADNSAGYIEVVEDILAGFKSGL
jgi:hypothetical protein